MELQITLISTDSLDADFTGLLANVCDILSNSPNNKNNLERCKDYCSLLKISGSSSNSLFSTEKIAKIKQCVNFNQLFEIVGLHMSWDEHSILTQIVERCRSDEGQEEVNKFEKKLAAVQGLQLILSTPQHKWSEDFARFYIVINKPYKTVTIEEYQNIKAYICDNLNVYAYVTVGFIRMFCHSLHIEWLVTAQAVPHMIRSANKSKYMFMKENFVFMQIGSVIVIDDRVRTRSCQFKCICMCVQYICR